MAERAPRRTVTPLALLRRFRRERDGAASVELAFGLPIILLIFYGIMEFGLMFWASSTLQQVAETTSRYAIVNEDASDAALTKFARSHANGLSPNLILVNVTSQTQGETHFLDIVVTYNYKLMFDLIPGGNITLTGRSRTPTY